MGLSKEYILQKIAELEAGIDAKAALPSEGSLIIADTEFTSENGKVYVIVNVGLWTKDLVINLPNIETDDVPVGFSFEVLFADDGAYGYRIEVISPRVEDAWGGDELGQEQAGIYPYPMDSGQQHVRFTYLGNVPLELTEGILVGIWLVSRLDNQLGDVRIAALATTAALPANTPSGASSTKKLTADSGGALTVDGQVVNQLGPRMSILVKDEGGNGTHNGIYFPIQLDPWILRRRSDYSFDEQIDVVGSAILITKGSANKGKTFYTQPGDNVEGNKTIEEAGGGGGIVPDFVSDVTAQYSDAAWHNISSITVADSPDRVIHARATIFASQGGFNAAKFVIEGVYIMGALVLTKKDATITYVYKDRIPWTVNLGISGAYDIVAQVVGEAAATIDWRCQLEISEHG